MFKGMNRATMRKLIYDHLPGPNETPVNSKEMEVRTGIPSRKVASIIINDMKHATAEVIRTRVSPRASPQNVYRKKL